MNDIDLDRIVAALRVAVKTSLDAENIPGLVDAAVRARLDMVLNSAASAELHRVVREAVKNGVSVHVEVKQA